MSAAQKKERVQIYYDMRVAPVTFDAAVFFAFAVSMCRKQGFYLFDVHIVASGFRNVTRREKAYTLDQRTWRLFNMITRLPPLIPGVVDVGLWRGDWVPMSPLKFPTDYDPANPKAPPYLFPPLLKARALGGDVQVFQASNSARAWARHRMGEGKNIVVALRSSDFNKDRDASYEDWSQVCTHLTKMGYNVFVIPDQWDVLYERDYLKYEWNVVTEAAIDLDLRLALYQECYTNIVWTGGHTALHWLSKSKFLMFGVRNEKNPVSTGAWFESQGITVGVQPNFFLPFQEFDWKEASEVSTDYMIQRAEEYLKVLNEST